MRCSYSHEGSLTHGMLPSKDSLLWEEGHKEPEMDSSGCSLLHQLSQTSVHSSQEKLCSKLHRYLGQRSLRILEVRGNMEDISEDYLRCICT